MYRAAIPVPWLGEIGLKIGERSYLSNEKKKKLKHRPVFASPYFSSNKLARKNRNLEKYSNSKLIAFYPLFPHISLRYKGSDILLRTEWPHLYKEHLPTGKAPPPLSSEETSRAKLASTFRVPTCHRNKSRSRWRIGTSTNLWYFVWLQIGSDATDRSVL